MISLKGQHLKLRALEPTDLDLLLAWENDTSQWHLSGTVAPYSRYILKRYLENAHQDIYEARQLRLIIETNTGKAIGTLDFFEFEPLHLRCGLGIFIADANARQKGFAFEALQLACNFAFKAWGLQQLFANILENNTASQALFKKLGFEKTGEKKAWVNIEGRFFNEGFYQLMKED